MRGDKIAQRDYLTMSSCHLVILSPCHPVTMSSCHHVILSSRHLLPFRQHGPLIHRLLQRGLRIGIGLAHTLDFGEILRIADALQIFF